MPSNAVMNHKTQSDSLENGHGCADIINGSTDKPFKHNIETKPRLTTSGSCEEKTLVEALEGFNINTCSNAINSSKDQNENDNSSKDKNHESSEVSVKALETKPRLLPLNTYRSCEEKTLLEAFGGLSTRSRNYDLINMVMMKWMEMIMTIIIITIH